MELFCMRIRLSKGNIEALHRAHEAGYDIVICTGRPLAGVRPIFERLVFQMVTTIWLSITGVQPCRLRIGEIIGKEELSLEDMHRLHVWRKIQMSS